MQAEVLKVPVLLWCTDAIFAGIADLVRAANVAGSCPCTHSRFIHVVFLQASCDT